MWQDWINGILGVVMLVFSYIYMAAGTGRTLMIIASILVAILGFWGGAMSSNNRYTTGTRAT